MACPPPVCAGCSPCMNVAVGATYPPPGTAECCPRVPGVPPVYGCCATCPNEGCPRGYKPCSMRMTPPASFDPRGIWIASVEPCPSKGDTAGAAYSSNTNYSAGRSTGFCNGLDDGGRGH